MHVAINDPGLSGRTTLKQLPHDPSALGFCTGKFRTKS